MQKNQTLPFVIYLLLLMPSFVFGQRRIKEIDPKRDEQQQEVKNYETSDWRDRVMFGGNFWISFWGNAGSLLMQPQVAYKLSDRNTAGLGVTYMYWSQNYQLQNGTTQKISDNAWGFNIFDRMRLLGPIFAHSEFATLNFNSYNYFGDTKRIWSNSLYLGGGYGGSKSGRGAYMLVLYDMLWRAYDGSNPGAFNTSFYPSPWVIRMGVFF